MDRDIFAFSATNQGYNHLKVNKVCEDASDFYDDEKMHICVVADGHGSDNYPRTELGSRFAVDAAISCIIEFVENAEPLQVLNDERCNYSLLTQLAKSILRVWYQAVEDDYKKNPFKPEELSKVSERYKKRYLNVNEEERRIEKAYGCTLIAFVITNEYSFGMQIGDGKCVVIDQFGAFSEPIPWDEDCQLNVTTSICDSDAIDEFRFCVSDKTPTAVFCGSDGIDDSYASSQELYALYRSILKIFIEHGIDVGKNEIVDYLPILTKRGSGDDVSIGTIIDMNHLKVIAPLIEIQAQIFKAETELAEKRHRLNTFSEKREALCNKLNNLFKSRREMASTATEIDNLTHQEELTEQEVKELECQLDDLRKKQQEMVFDREVESFGENSEGASDEVIEDTEDIKDGECSEEIDETEDTILIIEEDKESNTESSDDKGDVNTVQEIIDCQSNCEQNENVSTPELPESGSEILEEQVDSGEQSAEEIFETWTDLNTSEAETRIKTVIPDGESEEEETAGSNEGAEEA